MLEKLINREIEKEVLARILRRIHDNYISLVLMQEELCGKQSLICEDLYYLRFLEESLKK